MKTIIEQLEWPEEILNTDGTICVGVFQGIIQRVSLMPNNKSDINIPLDRLIQQDSYLIFNDALKDIKYPKLSPLSLGYYFNKLMVVILLLSGNKDLIDMKLFDEWLSMFKNPSNSDEFPFNLPLKIVEIEINFEDTSKPGIVILDEKTGRKWALSTMVFSHSKFISTP